MARDTSRQLYAPQHRFNRDKALQPDIAQQRADYNSTGKGRGLKIGKDLALADFIEERILRFKYSPGAVSAELAREDSRYSTYLSRWTIYKYIEKGVFRRVTMKDLPGKRRRKVGRGKRKVQARASAGPSISKRPPEIASREEFGHWEMDTVIGTRGCRKTLLVLTERKTREEIIALLPDRTAGSVTRAVNRLEKKCGRGFSEIFKSITMDNGCEFSDYEGLSTSIYGGERTKMYYCHAYSAWERGSNERANRLLRRWFPKKSSLEKITKEDVKNVEDWMNHYLRTVLGNKRPHELFREELEKIGMKLTE